MSISPIRRLIVVVFVLAIVLFGAAHVASAQSSVYLTSYVVRPGDRLASIARQYCTTWQAIYALNPQIGPNPDLIFPGMVLTVPNECGASGSCNNVYDRGPTEHAQGSVQGNLYSVVQGDTWFSISNRFGVPVSWLQNVNGYLLFAGTVITIPCLNAPPITPVPPTPTVVITSPTAGSVLPATFTVSGTGVALFEGNVVVRAVNQQGAILAERPTTMQGANVDIGGPGTWSTQLTVNVPAGTPGAIQALSPGTAAFSSVNVIFGSTGGVIVYPPGQCQIAVAAGSSAYTAPGGSVFGTFGSQTQLDALQRQQSGGFNWFNFQLQVSGQTQSLWVRQDSLVAASAGCASG